MKKLLNTLYVTTQGTYLAKDGECIVVRMGDEVRLKVPVHSLGGVVCFGQVSCSPFLMGFAAERGLGFSFLTEHGRFLARVQGPVSGMSFSGENNTAGLTHRRPAPRWHEA